MLFKMTQNFNFNVVFYFPWVRFIRKSLAIPHFMVKDISKIDPEKLKGSGITGVIFDKDNTLTVPYQFEIYPGIQESFDHFLSVYGERMVIDSNFVGTKDDPGYKKAKRIEDHLGVPVLRHNGKKPGGVEAVKNYFNCSPTELAFFGDMILTDVVFANRYGMLSIHTAPLTEKGENKLVAKIRAYETPLIRKWIEKGIQAPKRELYHENICIENLI